FRLPKFFAGDRVHRTDIIVESVEKNFPFVESATPINDVTTSYSLSGRDRLWLVLPFHRASFAYVQRIKNVRIWRNDKHCVANNDRGSFLATIDSGRKSPSNPKISRIVALDLVETTVAS